MKDSKISHQNFLRNETWKDIHEYEGLYQVSSLGNVRRIRPDGCFHILCNCIGKDNYYIIKLCKENKPHTFYVHRLVAEEFIENPHDYPQVNHIDGDKHNNCVNNLEWCTNKQNLEHSYKTGLKGLSAVVQMDCETGEIINRFRSTHEAGRFVGVTNSSISSACRRGHLCNGFLWRYVDGKNTLEEVGKS